ncbi:MAG: peroxiredoxin [Brumimicrobium sp.]|nr:peroxiredoxin [Brumimicrobium sp.]
MSVKKGDQCPTFTLKNSAGEAISISNYIGKKKLVIYFYPKDNTYGCTKQACSFRDSYVDFVETGAEVFGISSDSVDSHKAFARSNNLSFQLLSDPKGKVRKQFGVPSDLFGLIPGRVTYIVDKKGVIQGVFNSQLDPKKHSSEALRVLKSLE